MNISRRSISRSVVPHLALGICYHHSPINLFPLNIIPSCSKRRLSGDTTVMRGLSAIMFTDLVGYTSLTQLDESRALESLETHNRQIRELIKKFHAREVKTIGDSFLIEFDNVLEACRCSVEIQKFFHESNLSIPDPWKIRLRIGIHFGEVVNRQGDVFGDTVNIASRIQPLADPEGICISGQVLDLIRNKLGLPIVQLEQ